MSDSKSNAENHLDSVNRFIKLANELKDADIDVSVVSAAMMSASAVYATFAAAGNEGGLTPAGIEKVVGAYKQELDRVQTAKKKDQKNQH